MNALKILLMGTLALLLLASLAVGVFIATFEPNSYRDLLGRSVASATGRQLRIEGDLSLSVWPEIALRAEELSLANPETFNAAPMLRAEALEATIALGPLLQREIKIDGVVLYSPVVELWEKEPGNNNWEDLQERFTRVDQGMDEASVKTAVQLNSVTLKDAKVSLQLLDQRFELGDLTAELSVPDPQSLSVAATGRWQSGNAAPAEVSLTTNIATGKSQTLLQQLELTWALSSEQPLRIRIPEVELSADLQNVKIPQGEATIANSTVQFEATVSELQGSMDFVGVLTAAHADSAALLQLARIELPDSVPTERLGKLHLHAELSGQLAGDSGGVIEVARYTADLAELDLQARGSLQFSSEGNASGTIELAALDLQTLTSALPELFSADLFRDATSPPKLNAMRADFQWTPSSDGQPASLRFDNTRVQALGINASLVGESRLAQTATLTRATVELAEFSPRQVLSYFTEPFTTSAQAALSTAKGTLTLQQDGSGIHLKDLNVRVDKSRLQGRLSLIDAPLPTLRFDTTLNQLNASDYLTPADDTAATADVLGDLALPTELLRAYDLEGQFRVGQLRLFNLQLNNAGAKVALKDGAAELNNLSALLYGGSFIGKVAVKEQNQATSLAITGDLQRVDIALLMQALSNTHDFTGRGNVQINMTGQGTTALAAVQSAAGTLGLALLQGTYTGTNIGYELCKIYNGLRNKPAPPQATHPGTRFDTFSASASVTNGLAQTDDLLASNSYLKVTGNGATQLARQSINYDLDIELTGPIEEPNCETLAPFIGQRIPVRLTGTFAKPTLRPDFGKLVQREVRRRVEDKLTEKLLDLLGGKTPDAPAEREPETQDTPN